MSVSRTHFSHKISLFAFVLVSISIFGDIACTDAVSGQEAPPSPALWEKGKILFDNTCSVCHGPDGEGQGELGFKLTSARIRFASDEQIEWMIRDGNRTKGMPPFDPKHLEEGKLRDFGSFNEPLDFPALIAYIRHLQRPAEPKDSSPAAARLLLRLSPMGDPDRGKALFAGKARCAECHSIGRRGSHRKGPLAPDLIGLASRQTPAFIFLSILYPSETITQGFAAKELTLPRGRKVTGIFRNETSEAVEIYNSAASEWKMHRKSEVISYRTLRKSLMPVGLLEAWSEDEKRDLMAYLMTLR